MTNTRFSQISNRINKKSVKPEPEEELGMRIFIPTAYEKIILRQDWQFSLSSCYPNFDFLDNWSVITGQRLTRERRIYNYQYYANYEPVSVFLVAGTILQVQRFFIRGAGQENRNLDSMVFWVRRGSPEKQLVGCRFQVALRYVNTIRCDLYQPKK